MKKIGISLIAILYIIYFTGLLFANTISGDILSPVVTLISFTFVFWGYFYREDNSLFRTTGGLFAGAIFVWFLCDLMWGISTLILHTDPDNNLWIVYGYSVPNLLFLLGTFIFGIFTLKNKNRMQIFLDILITAACLAVLIWVFILDQDVEKARILKSDVVSILSLVTDVLIFAWINIWFFSVLGKKIALSLKFFGSGILLFVIIDFIYYYQLFYMTYQPNSLLDGGYVISFTLIAIGAYVRGKRINSISYHKLEKDLSEENIKSRFKNKLLVLLVPVLILIIGGAGMKYLFVMITCIMFYLLFTNYTQTNIFRDELLQKEMEHVLDLEEKVEARTREILRIMYTDVVTELNNRRYFEEFLNKQCSEIGKHEKILLLFIDQNKYKGIKGTYGKVIAEDLLKEVGKRIQMVALDEEATLSAYGEDVFVLLLRGQEIYEKGIDVANKIIHSCSDAFHVGEQDIVVTLNIGIACYPIDSKKPDDLIKNTDTAMMQAKELGVNKILTYTEQIGNFVYNRNKIEIKLKKSNF